jgi:hypothetical protein
MLVRPDVTARCQDVGGILSYNTSHLGSVPLQRITVYFDDHQFVIVSTRSNIYVSKRLGGAEALPAPVPAA